MPRRRITEKVDFHPLIKKWIDFPLIKDKSPRTVKNYAYNINLFVEWLLKRGKTLSDISDIEIARFIQIKKEEGRSTSYRLGIYWSIRSWVEYLNREEIKENGKLLISNKQLKKIQDYFPQTPRREKLKTKALTEEEVKKIFKTLHEPIQYMLFWTGINYGLRADEIINLELDDVDLTSRILCIKQGKGLKEREIPILDDHIEIWERWFQTRLQYNQTNHNYVFFASTGRFQIRNLQRYYNQMSESIYPIPEHLRKKSLSDVEKRELKAFKKKFWFGSHDLRRTFATTLYNNGLDILVISKMLGHNSLTTTQRYLRVEKNKIQNAYRNHFNSAKAHS